MFQNFLKPNPVRTAIDVIGGVTKTSNLLGVANGTVHAWISKQRIAKIDYAKEVAKLSGVELAKLRGLQ